MKKRRRLTSSRAGFLSSRGEVGFLRDLVARHRAVMPAPPRGPGDDAAAAGGLLITTDALVEGEHFLSSEPFFLTGRKSLAASLSDIAAMGGTPSSCLLALALPAAARKSQTEDLLEGFASAAREWGVEWVGGDVVRSPGPVVLAVTVTGRAGRALLRRTGARPGDGVYVTGPLGGSAAGRALLGRGCAVGSPARAARARWRSTTGARAARRLQPLLRRGARGIPPAAAAELLARHLDPVPRVRAGQFLSSRRLASAAMDLSDGLSLDLARLCEASRVGAVIHEGAIPISQATRLWAGASEADEVATALHGGEDYELLFTAPPAAQRALSAWPVADGTGPILIGRVRPPREGIRLADTRGRTRALRPGGYDPFRRRD